ASPRWPPKPRSFAECSIRLPRRFANTPSRSISAANKAWATKWCKMPDPPLVPLHADETLKASKLASLRRLPTEVLIETLKPGHADALRARPDGTLLNGNHRIKVL